MSRKRDYAREAEMVRRHKAGETFTAIGADYGITGVRVRQLVRRAGFTDTDWTTRVSREAWAAASLAKRVDWSCENCGKSDKRSPSGCARRFCSRSCWYATAAVAESDLLGHLRELSGRLGRTAGNKDIEKEGRHSHATYYRYFGSMRDAQIAAGLAPNGRGGAGHKGNRP